MAKYRRNYLQSVIVRLDFSIPPSDIDRELPQGLAEQITRHFPLPAKPVDVVCRAVTMKPPAGNLEAMGTERWKRWDFYKKRRDRFVRIERDFFCIEYKKYSSFPTLKRDLKPLMDWMADAFPDVTYKRLGLRYVDMFHFPEGRPLDWRKWISRKLLAALSVPPARERQCITRSIQTVEMAYDDMRLRFQYGIPNPDYPAPIKRKQFMFDTDASYGGLVEQAEVMPRLDSFHTRINECFERHITDAMREHLNAGRRK